MVNPIAYLTNLPPTRAPLVAQVSGGDAPLDTFVPGQIHAAPAPTPRIEAPSPSLMMEEPVGPVETPAEVPQWRRLARRADCERLGEIQRGLEAGTLKGEAFADAADRLSEATLSAPDRLVRRMAQSLLYDYVKWDDPVAEWTNKVGSVEGPTRYLNGILRRARNSGDSNVFVPEHRIDDMIKTLYHALDGYAVNTAPLRAMAHLAHEMSARADQDLKKDIRDRETADQDRAWASLAASAVDSWWQRGQIEVTRDGQTLAPGSVNLQSAIRGRRVAVYDGRIDLSQATVPTPTAAFEALKKVLDPYEKDTTIPADAFEALAPADAAASLDCLIASRGDHDLRRVTRLLEASDSHPATRALLEARVEQLSTVISRANAEGSLATNNLVGEAHVSFCDAFLKAFPERLDAEFFRRELLPLELCEEINTNQDACDLIQRLWDKHPELVGPSVAAIISAPDEFHAWRPHWSLIQKGLERGWRPDEDLAEWLLSHLYHPMGRGKRTIYNGTYDGFKSALTVFETLKKEGSPLVDGLEMPDTKGRMQPLRRALFDRFYNDPSDDRARNLYRGGSSGDPWRILSTLYPVIFPDAALTGDLLTTVEQGVAKSGSLYKMDGDAQAAFAVLTSVDLDAAQKSRFETVLRRCARQGPGNYIFKETLNRVRTADLEVLKSQLSSGALPAAQAIPAFLEGAEYARLSASYGNGTREIEKLAEAWMDGLKPGTFEPCASLLAEKVEKALAGGTKLGDLPSEDLGALTGLIVLARRDSALLERLRVLMAPRLDADQGYGDGLVGPVLTQFRRTVIDDLLYAMSRPEAGRGCRVQNLEQAEKIAEADYQISGKRVRNDALKVLSEALAASPAPGVARLQAVLRSPENLLAAYRVIAPSADRDADMDAECFRFLEVMEYVGGEDRLERALEAHAFVERVTAEGRPREAAMRHIVQAYSLGTTPDAMLFDEDRPESAATVVQREATHVRIGGVEVPIRK
ncbi:MAG: hypothetical protein FJX76_22295 [Armatimonadetes bacterium]|nr:hypothetical protein [Armatimonadota bacterium]